MEQSIGLIICWYGPYPWYFRYFIHSCRYNPSVDFIIITGNRERIPEKPRNVKLVYKTLNHIKREAEEALNLPLNIPNAYKLCDLRPAFGVIFKNILRNYTFWGHADIDIIFGNIRSFITEDILNTNDVISVRSEYVTGFFALYRNITAVNHLFKQSADHAFVFNHQYYTGFDECGLCCQQLLNGADINKLCAAAESITHVVKKMKSAGLLRAYFDLHVIESAPGKLEWKKGTLIYKNYYEVLLYHLISFKAQPGLLIPRWREIPDQFRITPKSFQKTKSTYTNKVYAD